MDCYGSSPNGEIKINHDTIDNYVEGNPDWSKIKKDYIVENPDWLKFVRQVSDNTTNALNKEWQANFDTNLKVIKERGSAWELQGAHGFNKIAIIVGASPALKKNVHYLKMAGEETVVVTTGSALKFLLSKGIKPEYVVICDSSILVKKQIEGVDTKGMT